MREAQQRVCGLSSSGVRSEPLNLFGQRVDLYGLDEMLIESGALRTLARRAVGMARQRNGGRQRGLFTYSLEQRVVSLGYGRS